MKEVFILWANPNEWEACERAVAAFATREAAEQAAEDLKEALRKCLAEHPDVPEDLDDDTWLAMSDALKAKRKKCLAEAGDDSFGSGDLDTTWSVRPLELR